MIVDRIIGQGSHQVDVLFHPSPVVTGEGTQRTPRTAKLEIRPDGSAVTRETEHANVAILCGDDLFLLSYDGVAEMRSGEIAFHGTALLLRRTPDGERRACMVDGRRLSLGGQQVFATDTPKSAASMRLRPQRATRSDTARGQHYPMVAHCRTE